MNIFLVGPGAVGTKLLDILHSRQGELLSHNLYIKVCGIINSTRMLINSQGIDLDRWELGFEQASQPSDIPTLLSQVKQEKFKNSVLVDCSSSQEIAKTYTAAFKADMHVVTANKKANSDQTNYYRKLRHIAHIHRRRFLYETNVGAGLPIIDTLKNLVSSGDKLKHFCGILSGSLSFIFGLLEEGIPFSRAIHIAREKKFTEPDPRDDLSGLDVARKLLILYREAGGYAELNQINIENIFPSDFNMGGKIESFMQNLPQIDAYFAEKVQLLKTQGKVMRLVGEISENKCRVGIAEIDKTHPLYAIKGGENAFAFETQRYSPIPLVVRGYGAGVDVTAAGVFSDILRTA